MELFLQTNFILHRLSHWFFVIYWGPQLKINDTTVKNLQIAWNYMPNDGNLTPNITSYFTADRFSRSVRLLSLFETLPVFHVV